MAAQTLFEKIWNDHVVRAEPDGTTLLYIDRHLVHEVTSPQAFEGLTVAGRTLVVPAPHLPFPTTTSRRPIAAWRSPIRSAPNKSKRWTITARRSALPSSG